MMNTIYRNRERIAELRENLPGTSPEERDRILGTIDHLRKQDEAGLQMLKTAAGIAICAVLATVGLGLGAAALAAFVGADILVAAGLGAIIGAGLTRVFVAGNDYRVEAIRFSAVVGSDMVTNTVAFVTRSDRNTHHKCVDPA
jgi:hypothetical protein